MCARLSGFEQPGKTEMRRGRRAGGQHVELDAYVGFEEEPVELVNRGALWKLALGLEARREAWAGGTEVGAPSIKQ